MPGTELVAPQPPKRRGQYKGQPQHPRSSRLQLTWEEFLRICRKREEAGNAHLSCEACGWSYSHINNVMRDREADGDSSWREAWDKALAVHNELIDAEIARRGMKGVVEPVYQMGGKVGTIRRYSDALLLARAKASNPAYRDKVDVAVKSDLPSFDILDGLTMRAKREIRGIIERDLAEQAAKRAGSAGDAQPEVVDAEFKDVGPEAEENG